MSGSLSNAPRKLTRYPGVMLGDAGWPRPSYYVPAAQRDDAPGGAALPLDKEQAERLRVLADNVTALALPDARETGRGMGSHRGRMSTDALVSGFRAAAEVVQFRDTDGKSRLVDQALDAAKKTRGAAPAALAAQFRYLDEKDQTRLVDHALETLKGTRTNIRGQAFSQAARERVANAGRILAEADKRQGLDIVQQEERARLHRKRPSLMHVAMYDAAVAPTAQPVGSASLRGLEGIVDSLNQAKPNYGRERMQLLQRVGATVALEARRLGAERPDPARVAPGERPSRDRDLDRPAPARIAASSSYTVDAQDAAYARREVEAIDKNRKPVAGLAGTAILMASASQGDSTAALGRHLGALQAADRADLVDHAIGVLQQRSRQNRVADAHGVPDRMADNAALVVAKAIEDNHLDTGQSGKVQALYVHPAAGTLIEQHRANASDAAARNAGGSAAADLRQVLDDVARSAPAVARAETPDRRPDVQRDPRQEMVVARDSRTRETLVR